KCSADPPTASALVRPTPRSPLRCPATNVAAVSFTATRAITIDEPVSAVAGSPLVLLGDVGAVSRQPEPLQRQRVDRDEHARSGHRDRTDLRPQREPERLENAGGDRQRERV